MKKLKDILSEAYAWERRPGKPLPTLAEVQAEYLRNEAANDAKAKVAKLEKEIADLKHQYYSDKNLTAEKSQRLRKQLGEKGRELKRAKREDRTGSAGYDKSSKSGAKPDFLDLDNDGDTEEPMKSAAKDMNEGASFQVRFADYSDDALRNMIVILRRFDGTNDDIRELKQELDRRKQDKDKVNEYGDDETDAIGFNATGVETYDAAYDTPKDAMTESFWNRVNGNLLGHDWILENRKKQLNESAVLDNIVIKKKSDSTVRVYNKETNKAAVYKLEYEVDGMIEPINRMIGGSKFDLTFDEISNKPNLSIEADLPVIKMVNYTIEFDKMQTNKIKRALEKNQNISIKWNMLRIIFTKQ